MDLEDGGYLVWKFKSEWKVELLRGQLCTGIILGHSIDEMSMGPTGPAILVVCKIDNIMERVGFGWVDQSNYKRHNKDNVCDIAVDEEGYALGLINPIYLEPLNLVKSWEEIRLG